VTLLHTADIPAILQMLLLYADYENIETILDKYVELQYPNCSQESKITSRCIQELGLARIHHYPALATSPQHHAAANPIKTTDARTPAGQEAWPWEDVPMYVNPPAIISTSLKSKGEHSISTTYALQGHFLAEAPGPGDHVYFNFTMPVLLEEFYIRCWHPQHPGARLNTDTYIDILPLFPDQVPLSEVQTYFRSQRLADGFISVGRVNDRCNAEAPLGSKYGKIRSARIRITSQHTHDIILREIVFKQLLVHSATKPCCEPSWPDPFQGGIPGVQLYDT